jgi:hypothetical protein
VIEPVYKGRGASVFGTFPGLVLNLTADVTDPKRVTIAMSKCKGPKIPPFNLELDTEARWFNITDRPVVTARTCSDIVWSLFEDGLPRKRAEIDDALKGQIGISTITEHLKRLSRQGKLIRPKRGQYQRVDEMPVLLAT